jgi:DNA-binding NarL/FixJ family response regulator
VTTLAEAAAGPAAYPRLARFTALVVLANQGTRQHLVHALNGLGAREVVEAASVAEARARALASGPCDLCVVDISLPDGSGLGLIAELRAAGWGHGLVVSSQDDPYTVRAALAAGVRGFLVLPTEGSDRNVPAFPRRRGAAGTDGLSGREIEVLDLVAGGQSNKDIGEALGLSALTVKSHLARIARKLGTGDRAEMVMVALRAGVIS